MKEAAWQPTEGEAIPFLSELMIWGLGLQGIYREGLTTILRGKKSYGTIRRHISK